MIASENPDQEEYLQLLEAFATSKDAVVETEKGTHVTVEDTRFRLTNDRVGRVLTRDKKVESHLTEPEKRVRAMVLAHTLSVDEFKKRVEKLKPELAEFIEFIRRTAR